MMYRSPIEIKRERQWVSTRRTYDLPEEELTLRDLTDLIGMDESFALDYDNMEIIVWGSRRETIEEVAIRVAKEEKYMENYRKFHANKEQS